MAERQNYDLGRILQTAEVIKGMRREAENDRVHNMYMGEQVEQMRANRDAAATEAQAQAKQKDALRVYHVADAVVRAEDPLAAIQNLAPDFVQEIEQTKGQGAFAKLNADQARQLFSAMRQQAGSVAGIVPKFGATQTGQVNGKDVFFQTDETTGTPRIVDGVTPRPPQKSNGISLTSPDGTTVQIGGDGVPEYGGVHLGKPTRGDLEKAFVNAQGNAYALREQIGKYRDEFSTFGGRFKAGIANMKEMAGMELAPQQAQFLNDFTSWKSDTNRLLSTYLNQLSGAAISPAEEARLKGGFPNADDGPTVYKSKAEATMRSFALAQARAAYLLSNPAQSLDSVSLEQMSNIIAQEANRLAKSLESGGMQADAARSKAINDTRARYGLNGQ